MDKSFVMLVGLPGCGKSTRAQKQLEQNPDAVLVSSDNYIEERANAEGIRYEEAWPKYQMDAETHCTATARQAFANGKSVIWDQTNLDSETRAKRLALVPADYFKAAIAFELDRDELVDRIIARYKETGKIIPPEIMTEMEASYQRPGRYEGFDHVDIIDY